MKPSSFTSFPLLAAVLAWVLSPPLFADTVLTTEQQSPEGTPTGSSTVQLSSHATRMDATHGGRKSDIIFRADKNLLWMIDPDARTYREMTQADMAATAKQVNSAMEEMKKQMAEMPPEQRAMMEKMMGKMGAMGTETQAPVEFRKVASGEKVGSWVTDKYEATRNGQKVAEMWVAPLSAVKIKPEEMQVMEALTKFFEEGLKQFMPGIAMPSTPGGAKNGIPVKTVQYSNGAPSGITVVKTIETKELPPKTFEIPDGFQKLAMPLPGAK